MYTLFNDLSLDEELIFASFGKSCREKIRSVQGRPDANYQFYPESGQDQINEFLTDYTKLVEHKHIPPAENRRLDNYLRHRLLALSCIRDENGTPTVWHAYRANVDRACLIYTVSLWFIAADSVYRNRIGKANRYAHWMDLRAFRALGVRWYDWGGWYTEQDDQEKLRISQFKEEFGGEKIENYNGVCYRTWKGKLFRLLKKCS